jgi:hypothetical protein
VTEPVEVTLSQVYKTNRYKLYYSPFIIVAMNILINGWFSGQATTGSGQYLHHLLVHLPRQAPGVRFSVLVPQKSANQSADVLREQ